MTLASGTRLGPYEILGPLGAGGMGEVYRAHDTKLGREVAIKVLPEELASDNERLARFEREARLLASLHHPYILSILDFGREHGTSYAATELLEGETLRARLAKGFLPISKSVEYAREVAQGLSAAHAKGVVHRDLKPENLFITKDGGVKILDFGLAKRSDVAALHDEADDLPTLAAEPSSGGLRTAEGVVLGTVGYMSPEQVRGETADARSDIFSFGAVCYEMLTGERAFRRDSALETMAAIARDDPPEMSSSGRLVSAPLEHVVRRCLEKSPDDRFQTARDLVFALEEASGSHGQARPPQRAPRRWRGPALTAIGVIVLLAVAVALTWWLGAHHRAAARKAATRANHTAQSASRAAITPVPIPAKSIAVLPFENLSADKNNAYFADGIQDEILTRLAKLGDLRVTSRTSASRYASRPENLKEVGRELGVRTLLEGSVQEAGDEVRVNVQLIDAGSDTHIWAQTYDRKLRNVFAVESDVAAKIATALQAELTPEESKGLDETPTTNPAAHEAYLRGLALEAGDMSSPALEAEVAQAFRKAVTLDPSFAVAWARLADALGISYLMWNRSSRVEQEAKHAVDRAVALAPDSGETWLARGNYAYEIRRDYGAALAAYQKAVDRLPNNSEALAYSSYVERRQGRFQEAIQNQQKAVDLDPQNYYLLVQTSLTYAALRRYPEALELVKRGLVIRPRDPGATITEADIYQAQGNFTQAAKVLDTTQPDPALSPTVVVFAEQYLCTHDYEGAIEFLRHALAAKVPASVSNLTQGEYGERLGFALHLAGQEEAAHAAYSKAVTALHAAIAAAPTNAKLRAFLGLAEAGLGHKSAALAAGQKGVELDPTLSDAVAGPAAEAHLARIQAALGMTREAVQSLQHLLAIPCFDDSGLGQVTPPFLKSDPAWDPIRKDPAFQALLKPSGGHA